MKKTILLVLVGLVFTSGCLGQATTEEDYETLLSEDFSEDEISIPSDVDTSQSFETKYGDWDLRITGKVLQSNIEINIVNDEDYSNVLEIRRIDSNEEGGIVSFIRESNLDISNYDDLRAKADIKLIDHTLKGSGWWGDIHDTEGEYPAHLFLIYEDSDGERHTWSWGFLNTPNPDQKINYELIPKGQWVSFESGNLMLLEPKPEKVVAVKFATEGWNFHTLTDNIEITGIE